MKLIRKIVGRLLYWALLPYYVLKSKTVSKGDKAKIYGALGYFVLPFDIIPDFVPIAGLSDDLSLLVWAVYTIWKNTTPDIKTQAADKVCGWLGNPDVKSPEGQ